jgi:SAM-dependent methyltransferase
MLGLLPPVSGARVLDAGCGAGWYAAELARRGALVTAIDASGELISHARARFASDSLAKFAGQVELKIADLEQPLSFAPDNSFDGIVSSLVLHYLGDWEPTLAEFKRILKPTGWLLFSTHHPVADVIRLHPERYLDVEEIEEYWKWVGMVRYYRRPLSAVIEAVTGAGFAIQRFVEPLPTEEFRKAKPKAYERLLRQPEFLLILARA